MHSAGDGSNSLLIQHSCQARSAPASASGREPVRANIDIIHRAQTRHPVLITSESHSPTRSVPEIAREANKATLEGSNLLTGDKILESFRSNGVPVESVEGPEDGGLRLRTGDPREWTLPHLGPHGARGGGDTAIPTTQPCWAGRVSTHRRWPSPRSTWIYEGAGLTVWILSTHNSSADPTGGSVWSIELRWWR